MKKFLIGLFFLPTLLVSGSERLGLELLPSGRPFRLTFSDPREIRMGISFQGNSQINATVGNYFSLIGIQAKDAVEKNPSLIHFGLEGAGYFTMRQEDKRFPLETADGLVGTYIEGAYGSWQGQIRLTHISAHLADGSEAVPISYSREFLVLRAGYVPFDELQIYSGVHYLINTVPKVNPWAIQIGGNYFIPFNQSLVPFVGFDLKWREESRFNPSFHALFGLALNNPPQAYKSFRFYYSYYNGADPRGQFYSQIITTHSVGIDMQI
jgi:hypothetical protein